MHTPELGLAVAIFIHFKVIRLKRNNGAILLGLGDVTMSLGEEEQERESRCN
jgi:hypothetical protein